MKIEIGKTERGFGLIEFKDEYGIPCNIQKSSLATEDAIWIGVDEVSPKILVSKAKELGMDTGDHENGWMDYPLPSDVMQVNRMHLTREQVKDLLPILQYFVEWGDLPGTPNPKLDLNGFKSLMSVGQKKGEMDFSINGSVRDLSPDEMREFRAMIPVAIKVAENTWSDAQDSGESTSG